jgi:hypothetical protein
MTKRTDKHYSAKFLMTQSQKGLDGQCTHFFKCKTIEPRYKLLNSGVNQLAANLR